MAITRCTFIGHRWRNGRYPEAPAEDETARFVRCRRCGKQWDVELGPGIFKYTAGGKF